MMKSKNLKMEMLCYIQFFFSCLFLHTLQISKIYKCSPIQKNINSLSWLESFLCFTDNFFDVIFKNVYDHS